ncbi:YraN family protein [Gryllotalpicola sp.]|uniref:YraN family protein n=1 Tax=Gryllotalpicola sp. TaxID=1932787 RepID=UPI0026332D90|nr:YraN family protein [Gryllotalpicola sp.]
MARKDDLGKAGEDLAVRYLERNGFRIIARNWRGTRGELDIIALEGDATVFVEVKTRSGLRFGDPLEAVTAAKLRRIRRLAGEWCAGNPGAVRIRLDVVGIVGGLRAPARITHVRGVS